MLPMLARTTGSALARNITGKRKTVRAGAIKPNTQMVPERKSGALVRQPKSSSAIMKPMAPLKEATGSAAKPAAKDDYMTIIHSKVLEIEGILKGTLAAEKEEQRQKRKARKDEDKANQEKKLEAKDDKQDKKGIKMPKVPQVGIFGWIKRFVGNVILGIFLSKMVDFAPALGGFIKAADGITTFLADVGIKLVDGLATFVDWGYKAYDATQGFLENFGVGQEQFDQFSGAVSGMIDALIIGSVILAARGEDGLGPGGLDKARKPAGRRPGVTQGRGGQPRGRFTNPFRRGPKVTQSGGPRRPGAPVTQGRGGRGTRPRFPGRIKPRLPGGTRPTIPGGTKSNLLLSLILAPFEFFGRKGEGQTDLQAGVGTAGSTAGGFAGMKAGGILGAKIGAFLGPKGALVGGILGGIIGGIAGSITGGSAADKLTGADKVGQYQEGGRITKSSKVKRGIKTKKKPKKLNLRKPIKQDLKDLPPPAKGQDPAQQRAWWDFLGWAGTGQRQPLGPGGEMLAEKVTDVGNTLGKDDFFGPILKATSKIILDQKIENVDYVNVGRAINLLINEGIKTERVAQGAFKYQEGGEVLPIKSAIDAGRWVEDTFKATIRKGRESEKSIMSSRSSSTFSNTGTGTPGTGTTPGGTTPSPGPSTSPSTGSTDVQANIQAILKAAKDMNYTGDLAAVLAIAKGETNIKGIPEQPITSAQRASEVWPPPAGFTVAEAQALLDKGGWRALYNEAYGYSGNDLGNRPGTNDGSDFIGRGFIQITGRHNYEDIGRRMGLDFIKNPDLLNERDISARAAITYMMRGGSPKDIESALVSVGGIKEGWPKKRRYYAEFKQQLDSGQLKLGQNKPATPNVQPSSPLTTPPSAPVGNASKPVGEAPGPANAEKEAIAGALGDYMKANRSKIGVTGSIHQWLPRHPGKFVRGYQSWHNVNRALDIGGWSPSSPKGGGADEQAPVIAALLEWNKKNGYNPVELIHGSPAYKNLGSYRKYPDAHHHHVHVAYEKGGMTLDGPHLAMLGERGKEIVIDNDSSISEVTPMLLAINAAKTKQGVLDAIQNFAPYDERSNKTIFVQEEEMPEENGYGGRGKSSLLPVMIGSPDNSFDFLEYQG